MTKSEKENSESRGRGVFLDEVLESLLPAKGSPRKGAKSARSSRSRNTLISNAQRAMLGRVPVSPQQAGRSGRETQTFKKHRSRKLKVGIPVIAILITVSIVTALTPLVRHNLANTFGGSYCDDSSTAQPTSANRIALVDDLSQEYPNPQFAANISSSAQQAGYKIDYFPPGKASLDFYINLPNLGYSMIILRTHGTAMPLNNVSAIATSDPYSNSRRISDQLSNRIVPIEVDGQKKFGITSDFVSQLMCGRFPGTLILGMFCYAGDMTGLSHSFLGKGAVGLIGWHGKVTVAHTDKVFEPLVKLLLEGENATEAVQTVMARQGPDPAYGSQLSSYP